MKLERQLKITILLLLAPLFAGAQQFVDLDWSRWEQDTVLPFYSESRPLGSDYALKSYTARIEYPEFQELTAAQVARFGLDVNSPTLPAWPHINTLVGVMAKQAQLDIDFVPIVYRQGRYMRINSFKLVIEEKQLTRAKARVAATSASTSADQRYAAHSLLSTGQWVKIKVTSTGVYKITASELSQMGFSNPDKVRLYGHGGFILPESGIENLDDDLKEVPLWRENNALYFYANGTIRWKKGSGNLYAHTQNNYSTYGCYFLTANDSIEPMAFPKEASAAVTDETETCTTYPDYALYEVEKFSWAPYGRKLFDNYDFAEGRTKIYPFDLTGVASGDATVTVAFSTNAAAASSLGVSVNGTSAGTMSFSALGSYASSVQGTQNFTVTNFSGNPTVTLTQTAPSTASGHLDFIRLNFTRELALRGSYTNFRTASTASTVKYNLAGANSTTHVWRVTEYSTPTSMEGTLTGSTLSFVTANSGSDEYVAVNTAGSFPSVQVAGTVVNQDLHALGQTDFVIIVPSSGIYTTQAQALAQAHRTADNLTVAVVRADQVYNEFSSGTPDATAYRRLLKMLYDRAATAAEAPKYLLLYGDGAWDNRMLSSAWSTANPDNYLLCFESENSLNEVRSYVMEDYFGLLDDGEGASLLTDKVDVGVGRFPVQTTEQATGVLNKTLAYMNNSYAGAWKNILCVLGDDGDNNQHMSDAEAVSSMLETNYPACVVRRIYWDTYEMEASATGNRYPAVQKRLKEQFEEGALMVNYSGHGAADVLSHELVLQTSDFEALNSPRLPLWITASCTVGPFDDVKGSIGEAGILNTKGGAIAMYTTTRTVYSTQNRRMNLFFSNYVLGHDSNGKRYTLGDAVRLSKCSLITSSSANMRDLSENKLQYVLLGDPALKLGVPEYHMVVDEFNASGAASQTTIAAGSKVTVKGHVADGEGNTLTNFDGVLHSLIMDSRETITTNNNQKAAADPFVYSDRTKNLFSGSDSVRNGLFSFSFPVPLDINYSYKSGLVNLYAIENSKSREANGGFTNFLIGGTSGEIATDTIGPNISLYLNTPDFIDGDEVNPTPYLCATLHDEDGINTVGNGIGHDIVAIVDNSAANTYVLNNYFNAETGDYTRGTLYYSLPTLAAGEHTLLLRAWDVLNNSSTATLHFTVVEGLSPQLVDVRTTTNPAVSTTTFVLTHDRPQCQINVKLELFNFMGQLLWSNSETTTCESNSYSYTWDLCASGGQPLLPGVYLYRATISGSGTSQCTKTKKLIILNSTK